ncbi:GNAT family acetyltransferase [Sphingomonas suaedae]|uniref:GNAT family acetyltransferase n=1 Tax=Sphingomonas suaedae TaxID=2599297 RepID=A0A518RDD4_9SPHN|nr:GNAT family acetyltransferase [Sphingomonas suaedae]QDX25459.1 GNAT family acetyltransferase [Sphingomonas suaedae]
MIAILPYAEAQFAEVDALWRTVFPEDPPHSHAAVAIPQKLAVQRDLLLVAQEDGHVLGTIMAGYDGHRGWLYKLAVHPKARGCGIAHSLVRSAERALTDLGCTKVNLQVRDTNRDAAAFWAHMGYAVEPRISMGRTL